MPPVKRPLFPIYDMLEAWHCFAYSTPEVKAHHHALYQTLLYQCKVRGGMTRFPLAYQHGMQASSIGSKATYLTALKDLQTWGFIIYTPGANAYKAPIVEAIFRESTENLLGIYRYSCKESSGRSKEGIEGIEVKRLEEVIREREENLSLVNSEIGQLKFRLSELEQENKRLAEALETAGKKKKAAPKKEKTQKAEPQGNFTELGRRFAESWSTWMLQEKGDKKLIGRMGVKQIEAFNDMADIVCARFHKEPKLGENEAVGIFVGILLRQPSLNDFLTKSVLRPDWFASHFTEIIEALEKARPGSVAKPTAPTKSAPVVAPLGMDERRAKWCLRRINDYAKKFGLAKVTELVPEDDGFVYHLDRECTADWQWPTPDKTRFAQEWQALNQPVHA